MSLLLAIDTCQGSCSAALVDNGNVLAERVASLARGHAEILMPMIEQTLKDAGRARTDIGRIAVTVGPGSFTGVRIGLAAAHGFSLARHCPLIGLTSFEAVAAQYYFSAGSRPEQGVVTLVAGRQGRFFMQAFAIDSGSPYPLAAFDEPQSATFEECQAYAAERSTPMTGAGLKEEGGVCALPSIRAGFMGRLALLAPSNRWQRPSPLYLRAPDVGAKYSDR